MLNIPTKARGDQIAASEFNAIVAELQRLAKLSVGAPLAMRDTQGGIAISWEGEPATSSVIVRIDSIATGAGVYNVTVGTPATAVIDGQAPAFTASTETGFLVNDWDVFHSSSLLEVGRIFHAHDAGERSIAGKRYFGVYIPRDIETGCGLGDS